MPGKTILQIQVIQNLWQWEVNKMEQKRLTEKLGKDQVPTLLWHGTRTVKPSLLYESQEGFDKRHSKNGMWGEAIYFALNASYSHGYHHVDSKGC